jgi:hypothetical protein
MIATRMHADASAAADPDGCGADGLCVVATPGSATPAGWLAAEFHNQEE